jgi:hypothetical protein
LEFSSVQKGGTYGKRLLGMRQALSRKTRPPTICAKISVEEAGVSSYRSDAGSTAPLRIR